MTETEFYELRDDRTSRIIADTAYSRVRVAISIGTDIAQSYPSQVAFVLLVNLLARCARHIRIADIDVALDTRLARPDAPTSLAAFALFTAKSADPFGDFEISAGTDANYIRVHVGASPPSNAYPISGDGWIAHAGVVPRQQSDHTNPLGAVLAATLGVAHVFKAAVGIQIADTPICLSLWNLRGGDYVRQGPVFNFPDLGTALMVGCGAVGSAIAWLLPLVDCRAKWTLVDGDDVEVSNLNRSPLFGANDVGRRKATVVSTYLRAGGVDARSVERWFDEVVQDLYLQGTRADVILPVANDRNVRHLIQHQIPPLQVYGTTGRNWDAFLGRHIPGHEDCLACRFPTPGFAPAFACGVGAVAGPNGADGVSADAALPFLPTAAAVMAVAELAKLKYEGFPVNANFACLDFRGALSDFVVHHRAALSECICQHQRDVRPKINSSTRFWKLSESVHAAASAMPRRDQS